MKLGKHLKKEFREGIQPMPQLYIKMFLGHHNANLVETYEEIAQWRRLSLTIRLNASLPWI